MALQIGIAAGSPPQQTRIEGVRYVGAVGCKSSSCHGGAGEKRSQYITWIRHDVHTRAFAILTDARSERIADTLGVPPGTEGFPRAVASVRCTICHAPFAATAQAQRSSTGQPSDGVSCENCHGAAGSWLRGHTRTDWTYATRVGSGMRDLKNLYVRANTCVACHQNLDADIAAAGHPPLVFELDGQSTAEPKHWRDEISSGPRAWLVGQAVALRELSWHLATNPSPNPQAREQWRALSWLLAKVTATESTLPLIDSPGESGRSENFAHVQQQADALARRVSQQKSLGANVPNRLSAALVLSEEDFVERPLITRELLYLRAQRLVLALDRLRDPAPPPQQFVELRTEIASATDFDAARFVNRLREYRGTLRP